MKCVCPLLCPVEFSISFLGWFRPLCVSRLPQVAKHQRVRMRNSPRRIQPGCGSNQNNSNKLLSEEAMPLFGNTFSPKKTPPRKSASLSNLHMLDRSSREIELGLEYGTPVMTLTGQSMRFENGQWIAESFGDTGDRREANRLRKRIQQLEEENNLLQLKIDILLDMLSETTAESHLMQKEMEELKNYSRKRK
ncbi:protein chibby homolog 1 isoform X4 [Podarcis muralis]